MMKCGDNFQTKGLPPANNIHKFLLCEHKIKPFSKNIQKCKYKYFSHN